MKLFRKLSSLLSLNVDSNKDSNKLSTITARTDKKVKCTKLLSCLYLLLAFSFTGVHAAPLVCSNEPPVALSITAGNIDTSGSADASVMQEIEYVTYTNAAVYNSTSIDVRLSLLSNPDNITVDLQGNTWAGPPTIYYPIFLEGTNADSAVTIQFTTYVAGTTTPIQVPFGLTIKDIDNTGVNEGVEFSTDAIQNYTLSATPATNISVIDNTLSLLGQGGNYKYFTNTVNSAGNTEQENWASTFHGKTDSVIANLKKRTGTTGYLFVPDIFDDPGTTVVTNCASIPTVASVGDASVTEGTDLVHTVTLSAATTELVSYPFVLADGTATAGSDYTNTPTFSDSVIYDAISGGITIPAGVTTFTVTYPTTVDALADTGETTTLTVGGVSGTGTINDAVNVEFALATNGDAEIDGGDIPQLLVNGTVSADQTIDVTVTGGDAAAGTDYTNTVSVTIPAGVYDGTVATALPINLTITDDALVEGNETIEFTLANPSTELTIGDANVDATTQGTNTYTITDDDAVNVEFALATNGDAEIDGGDIPQLLVNGTVSADQTIDVTVTGGDAAAGTDYTNTVSVTIPAGVYDGTVATALPINLTITDDALVEGNETIEFTLANPSTELTIGDANVDATTQGTNTYTITDDDAVNVEFALATNGDAEIDGGDIPQLLVNGTVSADQTIDVTVTGGDAAAGTDYTNTVSVTIPAGVYDGTVATALPINLTITDDALVEGNETIEFTLANPSTELTIGDANVDATTQGTNTYTITDDDAVNVEFALATNGDAEIDGGDIPQLLVNGTVSADQTIDVTVTGGDAAAGTDYTNTVSVTIPAGVYDGTVATALPINLTITDDALVEGNETIEFTLANPSTELTIGDANVDATTQGTNTYTITDDDAVNVEFALATNGDAEIDGGDIPQLLVNGTVSADQTIDVTVTGGDAAAGTDYTNTVSVTIPAGVYDGTVATALPINLTITDDALVEGNETIEFTLANPSTELTIGDANVDATTQGTNTYTITDDDAVNVEFALATNGDAEIDGGDIPQLLVNGTVSADQTIDVTVTGGDAAAGTDYTNTVSVTIPAGVYDGTVATALPINLTITDDALVEGNETIEFTLANPSTELTIGDANVDATTQGTNTYTITDDDAVNVEFALATNGDAEIDGGDIPQLLVNGTVSADQTIDVTVTGGDAAAGTDYTNTVSVTIPAGVYDGTVATALPINLTITDDALVEGNETIEFTLANPSTELTIGDANVDATTQGTNTYTITDDDAVNVEFALATNGDAEIDGGDIPQLLVNGTVSADQTIDVTVTGGDAAAGTDYTNTVSVTIPAGVYDGTVATALPINLTITDDALVEGNETIEFTLANPSTELTIGDANVDATTQGTNTYTITDDDAVNVEFALATNGDAEIDGGDIPQLLVNGTVSADQTIDVTVTGGDAAAGTDYTNTVSVTIPAGVYDGTVATALPINLTITDDALVEGNETIEFTLANPSTELTIGDANVDATTQGTNTYTITNDDAVNVEFALATNGDAEIDGGDIPQLLVNGTVSADQTIDVTVTGGDAAAGTDYTNTVSVTIPAGVYDGTVATALPINLTITDDALVEGNETIEFTLANPSTELTIGDANVDATTQGTNTYTITDDDAVNVEFALATNGDAEIDGGDIPQLLVNGTVSADQTIDVTVTGGDAAAGTDYTNTVSVTIPAGVYDGTVATALPINLTITDDALVEGNETIEFTLANPSTELTIGDANVDATTQGTNTYTITDDDAVNVEFALATNGDAEIDGGDIPQLLVNGTVSADQTIDVTVTGGDAAAGTDYTNTVSVTIPAGVYDGTVATALPINLTITDDALVEGNETIEFTLANPSTELTIGDANVDATTQGTNTYTITDDDAVNVEFALATNGDAEIDGGDIPQLLVNGTVSADQTIDVTVTGGDAAAGTDYTNTVSVTIPAGVYDGTVATALPINLTITDDALVEGNETIEFTLANPSTELTIGDANVDATTQGTNTYTITDDDAVNVEFALATNGDAEIDGGDIPQLLVNGTVSADQTIDVTVTGGDAAAGTDYTNTVSVTIPAGVYDGTVATALPINLTITDDALVEGNETIEFTLANPSTELTIGDANVDRQRRAQILTRSPMTTQLTSSSR